MITTKLVLRIDKIDLAGFAPIYLRITKNRKHAYLKMGIKTEPSFWDQAKQRLKTHYPNSTSANAMLRKLVYKVESFAHEVEQTGNFYTAKLIKDKVLDRNSDNLVSYAYRWVDERKSLKIITYSSYIKYLGIIKKLDHYCSGTLPIDRFNGDFVKKFELHLRSFYNNQTNTISSNLSCLRAISNSLIEENLIKPGDAPFKSYKFRFEESQRSFQTPEQLALIESVVLPVGSKIKQSQDIFLFCAQTGLRIGDALHLRKENFTGTHLIYFSQKTKEYDSLKVTTKAQSILMPYMDDHRPENAFIFDFLDLCKQDDEKLAFDNQRSATSLINKNLKIIGRRCGIQLKLHTHLARHSFAVNALTKGLSMEEIKAILNHNDIQTTQLYAKVVNSVKDQAINKLE